VNFIVDLPGQDVGYKVDEEVDELTERKILVPVWIPDMLEPSTLHADFLYLCRTPASVRESGDFTSGRRSET
jgi:hypothetical protein